MEGAWASAAAPACLAATAAATSEARNNQAQLFLVGLDNATRAYSSTIDSMLGGRRGPTLFQLRRASKKLVQRLEKVSCAARKVNCVLLLLMQPTMRTQPHRIGLKLTHAEGYLLLCAQEGYRAMVDKSQRGPSEADRGRTSLFGREPNAGFGLPSAPNVLPKQVSPEKSKSHSRIACIALGAEPVKPEFDTSFCFFRAPETYVHRDTLAPTAAGTTWKPVDRPAVAQPEDRPAGASKKPG